MTSDERAGPGTVYHGEVEADRLFGERQEDSRREWQVLAKSVVSRREQRRRRLPARAQISRVRSTTKSSKAQRATAGKAQPLGALIRLAYFRKDNKLN